MKKKHIGSSLNEFLQEENFLIDSELIAIKRLLAAQVEKAMQEKEMSKTKMAQRMGTSRTAFGTLAGFQKYFCDATHLRESSARCG